MNTTLPPSRDLPPGRHAEIRTALLSAVTPGTTRRWVAPVVTAAAAFVVIGMVALVAPWGTDDSATQVGAQPTLPTGRATAQVPGVDPSEVSGIEEGCRRVSIPAVKLILRQVISDQAGRLALLTTANEATGTDAMVVICELDAQPNGYNAGYGTMGPFIGPVTIDGAMAAAGGDAPGGKPVDAGRLGGDEIAGRVSPEVAKVTYVQGDESVDAVVANGTYLARIVHPSDWAIPENRPAPVVRAYDKNGTLLKELRS